MSSFYHAVRVTRNHFIVESTGEPFIVLMMHVNDDFSYFGIDKEALFYDMLLSVNMLKSPWCRSRKRDAFIARLGAEAACAATEIQMLYRLTGTTSFYLAFVKEKDDISEPPLQMYSLATNLYINLCDKHGHETNGVWFNNRNCINNNYTCIMKLSDDMKQQFKLECDKLRK